MSEHVTLTDADRLTFICVKSRIEDVVEMYARPGRSPLTPEQKEIVKRAKEFLLTINEILAHV